MVIALGQLASVSRSGWALSWILLLVYAAPLVVLIYFLDLYEREPVSVAIAAFLWGAFAATALALGVAPSNPSRGRSTNASCCSAVE